jgi:hypothetical protein
MDVNMLTTVITMAIVIFSSISVGPPYQIHEGGIALCFQSADDPLHPQTSVPLPPL